MWANNETGVTQDISELSAKMRVSGGMMHIDAAQAAGKIEVDFSVSGAHLMSLSAHKIKGPKGAR
jgi:cysteine desulfurase